MAVKKEPTETKRYKKEKIVSAKRYASQRDLVNALLEENQEYTLEEVDSLIDEFLKRKVN